MNFLIDLFADILEKKAVEKLAAKRIYSWYKKYKEVRKKIGKIKSVYNLMINPNNWMHAISSIPRKEANDFFKELANWKTYYNKPEFKNNNEWMYDTAEMPNEPGTQKFKPNKQAKEKLDQMSDELNGHAKWVNLSSSWIKRGMWKVMFKQKLLGTLSIETRTGETIYAYPMVPYDVWVMMKEANGINGTRQNPRGAGSVFWKYWLDRWLPSMLRKKVKNDLENKRISKDEYNVALDQVQRSSKAYYRTNTSKYATDTLNKEWYLAQGRGKGFYTRRYNTYKSLYTTKYTSQYYTEPHYGFTSDIKINRHRNPDYINKKQQAQARRVAKAQAKAQAKPYQDVLKARRVAKNPIGYAKGKVRSKIKKTVKKWGK